mgnify:CR=1 FL=1
MNFTASHPIVSLTDTFNDAKKLVNNQRGNKRGRGSSFPGIGQLSGGIKLLDLTLVPGPLTAEKMK